MDTLSERIRQAGDMIDPPEPALERLIRYRDRRNRKRRIASAGVAMAVAVAGVGGAVYALRSLAEGDGPRVVSPAASNVEPPAPLKAGEYFSEKTILLLPDAYGLRGGRVTEETWWSPDGSGRRVADSTTPDYGLGPTGTWDPGEMPVEDLSELSTDPAILAGQLLQRSAPGGASPQPPGTPGPGVDADSATLWRAIGNLLEMPNAEPALRAALFEVAAGLPDVEVRAGVEDPVGRKAVVLRFSFSDADHQLFFAPDTGQLLASAEDYGGPVWYRIVVVAGIVGTTEDRPEGGQLLVPAPVTPLPENSG